MSYCLNPNCPQPKNSAEALVCKACGWKLLLQKKYSVLKKLGQGGFGATFLAQDEILPGKPKCVIKQLQPAATEPNMLQMAKELFKREAQTLGKIGNHPQVPTLLNYFDEDKHFYLVQEYISGLTLQQEIKQSGPLSEAGVKQFLSEILPLIQYIHRQKVIHRDIKPANIIRRDQDRKLVLIDFGAVKDRVDPNAAATDQTALTNFAIGTPGFAPPEQMALRPVYASDLYALGITCIYLLTGKSPKDLDYNPSTGEMLWRNYVDISDHFAEVLKKMLESAVRHRYQSSEEILRALDLEPYIQSLAEGLATKSNSPPKSNESYSQDFNPSRPAPSSSTSATAKMAELIRARKAQKNNSGSRTSGLPRSVGGVGGVRGSQIGINSMQSQGFTAGRKITSKLDANGVLKAYARGRKDFASQDLRNLNLEKAKLTGGIFQEAKLAKVNLQEADLTNAIFGQASLKRANLRGAILVRAYFNNADLEGADLRSADLSYAHITNANLKGANLCGANLSSAKVTEEQLAQAKTNWSTVFPNGKRSFKRGLM
ncbi:MAG: protein kinase [Symploca sp. SIO1B1]|nr:protein kinase [Symploca sp. SIO1C2]NER97254.1 protein kinase [Symploca sp. SIO1B1]